MNRFFQMRGVIIVAVRGEENMEREGSHF